MTTLNLKGKVSSGRGEAALFTKFAWVERQVAEKLGFVPYPGTLNLRLVGESVETNRVLRSAEGIKILPARGFCRGKLFKAVLEKRVKCAIVVPEVDSYPEDIIEVVASINLKEKLQLGDGDEIEIKVMF